MSKAPFAIQPDLTAISLAYTNKRLIADSVMPRVGVNAQEFKYTKHTMEEGFTLPDTKVGRKGKVNEVSFAGTEVTDSTNDYGLEDPIPQRDIDNAAGSMYDPEGKSTESLTALILLDREKRVADTIFNTANYGASNQQTLSGTSQWSDRTNSTPIDDLMTALDSMIMRANVMAIGRAVATQLVQHPQIVKAYHGNSGDAGIVPVQFLAQLLELEEILVGEGWLNTAKKGQTPTMTRVWGKHCSLMYRDINADTRSGMTYGFTAEFGERRSGTRPDPDIGLDGGTRVRVGESVKEVVTATDLGYLFENAVG